MHLKRVELSGFKSFARPTTLSFESPITAIVGPNGAGKSNIAEAIRFVLGEQSMKSLRGKHSEDLIWNGTKAVPRQGRASVSACFDNRAKIFNIDYDEVVLKRVVYRDGTSEYFINGSRTRLKDVVELLADAHIGASSHHIISQGEADRILSAQPKERKRMIEDALGLRIHELKRVEAERKLARTRENIAHVEALRKEIAPHLRFLEKQVEKVRRAEGFRKEIEGLYREYLAREKKFIDAEEGILEAAYAPVEAERADVEKTIREKERALGGEERPDRASGEIRALEEELSRVRARADDLSRNLGRLEGILEYREEEASREEAEAEAGGDEDRHTVAVSEDLLRQFIDDISAGLEEVESTGDAHSIKDILYELRSALREILDEHAKERDDKDAEDGTRRTAKKEAAKRGIEADIAALASEKRKLEEEIDGMKKKESGLRLSIRDKKEEREKEMAKERSSERELFELKTRRTELVTRLELFAARREKLDTFKRYYKEDSKEAVHFVGENILDVDAPLPAHVSEEENVRAGQETRKKKIERLKIKIEEIGTGGAEVMKEYDEAVKRDGFLKNEVEDLERSAGTLGKLIRELRERIGFEFKAGVRKINKRFQSLFSLMFDGGTASVKTVSVAGAEVMPTDAGGLALKLDEPAEEAGPQGADFDKSTAARGQKEKEEGIEISINLPRKKIKGLAMLSGGERALASVCLIFAVTQVHPPPFLVLDETDAALDESNSRKFGNLLEELAKETELVIITHNRETMTRAGVLYGVTSAADGVSRLLSIKLEKAVEIAE